ncbi:MAG: MOSC domain-containing protein [Phycisphaerales bacterium]
MPTEGRIHAINRSDGGVPKLPVDTAEVTPNGLIGDRQRHTDVHGGPERAVCIYSLEVIRRLQAEGHPIEPGTAGENLTLEGLDWSRVDVGCRFVFDGGVELEVAAFCPPCKTIRASFVDEKFGRILQKKHPGESRVYARVLRPGRLGAGESVRLVEPA